MELLIDKPIENLDEDKFGRTDFVKAFSKMILNSKTNDGMVILLNGEWGCGKTSIINLIKNQIKKDYLSEKNIQFLPLVYDFSPWNIINQDGIIFQFFDTLSSNFNKKRIIKILKTIKNSKGYKATFKTIQFFSCINKSIVLKAICQMQKQFDKYVESLKENENLYERKNEIIETLYKSHTKHIIFIDDLDRLNDAEIKLVIQLIKSVCNFPNIIYVLSADSKIIESAIKNEQSLNCSGGKYLEKIIQLTFDIPAVKKEKIFKILDSDLSNLFKNEMNEEDVNRLNTYIGLGLFKNIKTIRDEKRYINLLKITYGNYNHELDIPDFIAASYLRFLNSENIQLLLNYIDFLFGASFYKSNELNDVEKRFKNDLQKINNDESLFLIIKEMFPNIFRPYEINQKLDLSKRICSKNKFYLFLTQQLDFDDLSAERLNLILQSKDYDNLVKFSNTITEPQGRKFLLYLIDYVDLSKNLSECEFIAKYFLKNLSNIKIENKFFCATKDCYARDFIKKLCKKYGSSNTYSLIEKYINKDSDIYSLSELAIELNLKEDPEKHNYGFSEMQIKNITNTSCNLIFEKIKSNNLSFPRKARFIRFLFVQRKDEFKLFFDSLNDEKKIDLICDMILKGSMYDTKRHITYDYSLDCIISLIGQNELHSLINKYFNNLENYKKQRILVLKMKLEGFKPFNKYAENRYFVEDINNYCKTNNIQFNASESYEINNDEL